MTAKKVIKELNRIFGTTGDGVTLDESWRPTRSEKPMTKSTIKVAMTPDQLREWLDLEKAKKMAIGTVSRGRKKVAEGGVTMDSPIQKSYRIYKPSEMRDQL